MKGKNFLKVTGIIMIIGGAFGIILDIFAILGVSVIASSLGNEAGTTALLYLYTVLILVSAIFELIAGIMGVKNCDKPEKAQSCIIMGVIVGALCIIGNILSIAAGSTMNTISLVTGLVLPVLYVIGAVMNKKEA